MSPQQSPNSSTKPQTPSTGIQLPSIGNILDKAEKAAGTAVDVLSKADLPETALAVIKGSKVLINARATVLELDKAVKDLEKAAPGTVKLVKETADAFAEASKIVVDPKKLPTNIQPIAAKGKEATESFAKFAKDYDAYDKASFLGKPAAAIAVQASWKDFQTKYKEFNDTVDKSGIVKDVTNAANNAINKLKGLIP